MHLNSYTSLSFPNWGGAFPQNISLSAKQLEVDWLRDPRSKYKKIIFFCFGAVDRFFLYDEIGRVCPNALVYAL